MQAPLAGFTGADPAGVASGDHFMDGDFACAEGALAAGCRFIAGYPITPSTEVVEHFARRIPTIGGVFIQMEDEIAASIAIQGAVWAGHKSMTVTSGPGFSLMMEHIGLAAMAEVPCVFVDVQRGGPSTGLPTLPGQADVMQARWGSHGDYEIIAICPNSPQESFDFTIDAFNLAEQYRVPVMLMMDECVGHMHEKVTIPRPEDIKIFPRRWTKQAVGSYLPYKPEFDGWIPGMVKAGDGHFFHITGLTHDERGYPAMSVECQESLVRRLVDKIRLNADAICRCEEIGLEDAEIVLIAYGITSRVAYAAMEEARRRGLKVGLLRPIILWPFPERRIRELAEKVNTFVVAELNYGQLSLEVERCAAGKADTILIGHGGGTVHEPEAILEVLLRAAPDAIGRQGPRKRMSPLRAAPDAIDRQGPRKRMSPLRAAGKKR
ncbi:MAG: 2-oxoglutarate synthase subunit alpha [Elusimicrobia bacterium GWA2_69_24]|nr:MAG: 2-oxoglutarate synthase subunit alpha [Elusimicrobia bacterium GWA2_69_24]